MVEKGERPRIRLLINLNISWDPEQNSKGQTTGNQEPMKQEGIFHHWTNDESTHDNELGIMNSKTSNVILGGENNRWRRERKKCSRVKDFIREFHSRIFPVLLYIGEKFPSNIFLIIASTHTNLHKNSPPHMILFL